MQFEQAAFPVNRFRRLRRSEALRDLVGENRLSSADFIWPLFIRDGQGDRGANPLNAGRKSFIGGPVDVRGRAGHAAWHSGYMFVSIYR